MDLIAIDGGKHKTGIAVLSEDGRVKERKTVLTSCLMPEFGSLTKQYSPAVILIGSGGTGKAIEKMISLLDISASVIFVNEKGSTVEAKRLYWKNKDLKWYERLIPSGLRAPKEPYDDLAAVVIASRYLGISPRL